MAAAIPPAQSFFDPSYSSSSAEKYHLSLQISEDRLLYVLINTTENKLICLEEYKYEFCNTPQQLEERLKKIFIIGFFRLNFKSISVYYVGKIFSFVPYDLYEKTEEIQLLKLNFRLQPGSNTHRDKLSSIEAYNVYSIPEFLPKLLHTTFVSYQLRHYSTSLIQHLLNLNQAEKEKKIYLNVQKHHFEMLLAKEGKLLFFNRFEYSNAEDFLYFLLYAMEKLNQSNEHTGVFLAGEIETSSELYALLYKYIKDLKMLSRPENIEYTAVLRNMPKNYYFNLFSQYLCG